LSRLLFLKKVHPKYRRSVTLSFLPFHWMMAIALSTAAEAAAVVVHGRDIKIHKNN
jgi:long-subunit acyl-CoA synthetase (AMP-forming)